MPYLEPGKTLVVMTYTRCLVCTFCWSQKHLHVCTGTLLHILLYGTATGKSSTNQFEVFSIIILCYILSCLFWDKPTLVGIQSQTI